MKTYTVKELSALPHDCPVEAVEGILVSLYDPETVKKDGSPIQYPYQNGVLKGDDGAEHRIRFTDPTVFQPKELKGKRILLKSIHGKHGITGLKIRDDSEPKWRRLSVSSTAQIEVAGRNGAQQQPTGPSRHTPPAAPPASQSTETAEPTSTVAERIAAYLDIVAEVKAQADKKGLGLSLDNIKDVATHISMTYRGQYGSYASPVFSKTAGEAPVAVNPAAWKDVASPSTGIALGKLAKDDPAKFAEVVAWAFQKMKEQNLKPAVAAYRDAALAGASEMGLTPSEVFEALMEHRSNNWELFDKSAVHEAFQRVMGVPFYMASDDNCIAALGQLDKLQESIEENADEIPF